MSELATVIHFPTERRHPARPEAWLTKAEIAERLGVSTSWIQRRMREGLPFHKDPVRGRVVRFLASEVDDWMRGAT